MESFIQAVGKVESVLDRWWYTALSFIGATEDSSIWWKSVFERKILKGNVGISISWFHNKKIDVLWELEALVGSLSKEHQASAEKLKEISKSAMNISSSVRPRSEHDCNLNNYWLTKQASNEHLQRRNVHKDLNTDSVQHEGSKQCYYQSVDKQPEQYLCGLNTCCDFNQSAGYNGVNLNPPDTAIKDTRKRIKSKETADLENCPKYALISHCTDCRRLRRSASCPNILFDDHGSTEVENSRFHLQTNICSLHFLHLQEITCRHERSANLSQISSDSEADFRRTFCSFGQKSIDSCNCLKNNKVTHWIDEDRHRIISKDLSSHGMDLDTLLLQQSSLSFLWEDSLPLGTEMQTACDICKLYDRYSDRNNHDCYLQSQNVIHSFGDNVFSRRVQYDCATNIASLNNSLDEQDCPENIKTEHDRACKTVDVDFITEYARLECGGEEISNQMNWNALNDFDVSTSTQITGRYVDRLHNSYSNPTSKRVAGVPKKTVMQSISSSEVDAHPYLQNTRTDSLTDYGIKGYRKKSIQNEKNIKSFLVNLMRKWKNIVTGASTTDDTSVPIHSVKKIKGTTDLTKQDSDSETESSDIVHSMKLDISVKPDESAREKMSVKRQLGLDGVILPEPPSLETEDELRETQSISLLPKFVSIPVNWIRRPFRWITSFWNMNEELDLDEQKEQIRLHDAQHNLQAMNLKISKTRPALEQTHYLTGHSAYMYYKLLAMTEAKYNIAKLEEERNYLMRIYKWKQDVLISVVRIARDYYNDPTEMNLARWKCLKKNLSRKHQSYTDVAMQVTTSPDYLPYFTISLTTVQVFMLCIMCLRYGITKAGVLTVSEVRTGVPTYLGTEAFRRLDEPNPWFGPPVDSFLAVGTVLAACIGPLEQLKVNTHKKGYKQMTQKNRNYFGCCEMEKLFNMAGTSTQHECVEMTSGLGKWKMGIVCSARPTTKNSIAHVIKPCCTGYLGDCSMMSHEHCSFIHGIFHITDDHCVQVNCLIDICTLSRSSKSISVIVDEDTPWLASPETKWQWWRFLTAIPLVYGVIHFLVLMPIQLAMMIPLEMCLGSHRVFILYVSSSVIGEMVAVSLEPSVPHVGSTSGVGGIVGVAVLELFQAWNVLRYPQWEAIKMSALIIIISFLGTFYLISILSFITGLLVGMMVCLIIVPYITYGRRLGHFRCRLVVIGCTLTVTTLVSLQPLLQLLKDCHTCLMIECIPYTTGVCNSYYRTVQNQINLS